MCRTGQIVGLLVVMVAVLTGVGCTNVPKNGNLSLVQTASDQPRAGNVYLLRGWIGIFSRGIDDLGEKLETQGIRANVYQADQWGQLASAIEQKYAKVPAGNVNREPLVLVGHSYGADNVVRIARHLRDKGIAVDLMVTLDPVTPPAVPGNVARTYNLYQTNGVADALPWLRGIPLTAEAGSVRVENVNIRERKDLMADGGGVDHFNVEKKPAIHQEVIRLVETVCLNRGQWLAMRNGGDVTGQAQLASGTIGGQGSVAPVADGSAGVKPGVAKPAAAAKTVAKPLITNNGGRQSVSQRAESYGGVGKNSSDPWSKGGQ